jgi:hypothetical protein
MKRLRDVSKKVKVVLSENEQARNDDNVLYLHVLRAYGNEMGLDTDRLSTSTLFLHCNELRLPSYKSVERARRLLQSKHPELKCDDNTQRARDEQEMKYEKFSREVM